MIKKSKKAETEDKVAVIGLGYVGLTLATVFAEEGAQVIGVDANEMIIDALQAGMPHFYEPELEDKLAENASRLTFVTSVCDAHDANAFIIAVGSSVDTNGKPDYSQVDRAAKEIGGVLKKGDIVILRSTVTIGTTRTRVVPILEENSHLIAGKDFFVSFAPERTIEGRALEELHTLPQVIAGLTPSCRDEAARLFSRFASHIVLAYTLEEAEMVKLVSNAYRDLTFGFANAVALIASEHNVNVNTMIRAANEGYERNRIPLPSPGVGGYCLTKDPLLLAEGATKHITAGNFLRQGRAVNAKMEEHVADIVSSFAKKFPSKELPSIVIVGLAFKGNPSTSDVRFSPSQQVILALRARGFSKISGFDPRVSPDVFDGWKIGRVDDIKDVASHGEVIILMHMHDDYRDQGVFLHTQTLPHAQFVLDPWGMYNEGRGAIIAKGIAYANLGFRSFE
jgi:UDP-N-acetyl-D-mannosaminuronic acid dehydrogenase